MMRGRSGRGAAANLPKTSASPGSIKKYTSKGGKESPGIKTGPKSNTESPLLISEETDEEVGMDN